MGKTLTSQIPPVCRTTLRALIALASLSCVVVHATDAFEPSDGTLQLGFVRVEGGASYASVVARVSGYEVLGVDAGAAKSNSFDPNTGILTVGAVAVDKVQYNNVRVRLINYAILNAPTRLLSSEATVAMASQGVPGSITKNTPEYNGFVSINAVRVAGGFGATSFHAQLQAAATAHQKYLQAGPVTASGTDEVPGNNLFTGKTTNSRCSYQGFAAACFEVATATLSNASIQTYDMVQPWTGVISDLQTILDYRNVMIGTSVQQGLTMMSGIAWVYKSVWTTARANVLLPSDKANGIVGVFPHADMSNVGIGGADSSGAIVLAQFPDETNPTVTSFTLRKDGASTDHPASLVTAGSNTAAGAITQPGWAILHANTPLMVNTRYTVNLTGSWKGHMFSKAWSFTTGSSTVTPMLR